MGNKSVSGVQIVNFVGIDQELLTIDLSPCPDDFQVTLHRNTNAETEVEQLGLSLLFPEGKCLYVKELRDEGLVPSWNKKLENDSNDRVQAGDIVVCVNGVSLNAQQMLQECRRDLIYCIFRHTRSGAQPASAGASPHQIANSNVSEWTDATWEESAWPANAWTEDAWQEDAWQDNAWQDTGWQETTQAWQAPTTTPTTTAQAPDPVEVSEIDILSRVAELKEALADDESGKAPPSGWCYCCS